MKRTFQDIMADQIEANAVNEQLFTPKEGQDQLDEVREVTPYVDLDRKDKKKVDVLSSITRDFQANKNEMGYPTEIATRSSMMDMTWKGKFDNFDFLADDFKKMISIGVQQFILKKDGIVIIVKR